MNDPNGLFYWNDRFHLFYQYNPYSANWGFIHWGHAVSEDLIHWQDQPIALRPGDEDGDGLGCFSGCMVEADGQPTAIYTGFAGINDFPILTARSQDPELIEWEKSEENPVIAAVPEGVDPSIFRDPYVWRRGDQWQAVIGAGFEGGTAAALLYESADLASWEYLGPLFQSGFSESVGMWECPNFFPLGDKYVLLVSLHPNIQGVYYYTGTYDGRTFTPEMEGYVEQNQIFYAPQVRRFSDGRTVMFAWVREGRTDEAQDEAGWSGVQCFPRELTLDEDGRLISKPIAEIAELRGEAHLIQDQTLQPDSALDIYTGCQFELKLTVTGEGGQMVLDLLTSADAQERTQIGCDLAKGAAWLDTTQSSRSEDAFGLRQQIQLPRGLRETFALHVLVDHSVIEVWFGEGVSLTGRAYPVAADAQTVRLSAVSGEVTIRDCSLWEMDSIW
jgi:beta-fructofuranosidase